MKVTIEFNGMGEIHPPHIQSDAEKRIVQAVAKKLPKEIAKVERDLRKLREHMEYLTDMNNGIQDWAKEEVVN